MPGIYHIPKETDLATLISLSGGADNNSDITKLKYTLPGKKTVELNLYDHIGTNNEIKLSGGEIIYIPRKEGWVSNETATTVTVLISVLSLVLTGYVVNRTSR